VTANPPPPGPGDGPPPPPPPSTPPLGGPGQPAPPAPAVGPPAKKSNKGCVIALAIVAVVALLAVGGVLVGAVFLGRAVNEAVNESSDGDGLDGGLAGGLIPGLPGGDCVQFQMAYMTLTMGGFLSFGADPSQIDELDQQLREMGGMVPSEIEDDFDIVTGAFRESMQVALGSGALIGGEPSEEQTREAEAILESPEVLEAQENVNNWLEDNCT
jgi:hypothetical protein